MARTVTEKETENSDKSLDIEKNIKHDHHHTKWNPFFDMSHSSNAFAIRFKELDQCCCADVPCISIVKEYCESSSLHGLRYITENGRHWTERALWVVLCLLGFILTIYFIFPIWTKWHTKPTLTTLDSTDHPIWKIDFPGVTICPANKASKKKLEQMKKKEPWLSETINYGTTTQDLKRLVDHMIHFKDYNALDDYSGIGEVFDRMGQANITNLMMNIIPSCDEYLLQCNWQGKAQSCKSLFEARKTDDGVCCSFNTIRTEETMDWSMLKPERDQNLYDANYYSEETDNQYLDFSSRRGLTVLLDTRSKEYFAASDNFVGFKILVHDPKAYPEVDGRALIVGPAREFFMTITGSHTEGSEAIRSLPIERRNCLFGNERKVKQSEVSVFKEYSQGNCLLECRAKLLLKKCGCLPYYYPPLEVILQQRTEFSKFNSTCNWSGWTCLVNSTELLEAIDVSSTMNEKNITIMNTMIKDGGAMCDCPPTCTRTNYLAAQSFADFPNKASDLLKNLDLNKRENVKDLALLHIFFRELKVFKYTTDELFSWNDILASFGGLVGLCTGFSFLSLAEVLYFFSLRCTLPLCRKRKNNKVTTLSNADLVVVKVDEEASTKTPILKEPKKLTV